MHPKSNISKATFFLGAALLFSSFKFSDWEFDKKYVAKIQKSVTELFEPDSFDFEEIIDMKEICYAIKETDLLLGYLIVAKAPSMYHEFDYYVIFNKKGEILRLAVLQYRENYGAEICNKNWLKQFIKIPTSNFGEYNRKIDGISGATISVNNIKTEVFKLANEFKKVLPNNL